MRFIISSSHNRGELFGKELRLEEMMLYIPSLEEYAKIKKYNSDYNNIETLEMLSCEECRYCRPGANACIFGNQIRNLDLIESCPRLNRFL